MINKLSPLFCLLKFLWLSAALSLASCATTATQPEPSSNLNASVLHKQHMEQINKIQQFSLNGRLGVITKPKNHTARLAWQHMPEKDTIDVYSPLGGKVANIVKTPEQVTLTDRKGKSVEAQDVATLTEKTLGFRLPLSGLSHWALGRPNNKGIVSVITWDNHGRIISLQQNGWEIQYQHYIETEGVFLPKKVTLKNEKIILKIIIEKWAKLKPHAQ